MEAVYYAARANLQRLLRQHPDYQQVVDRVLEIRDDRTFGLGHIPGPKAILYYLGRDESLKEQGLRLPKSTRTIHRLLRENGRIASRPPRLTDPIERPKPMEHWQLDFKDASTVPADPHGKRQHVVETLNMMDQGTSVLVAHHVRSDFTAETAPLSPRTNLRFTRLAYLYYPGP